MSTKTRDLTRNSEESEKAIERYLCTLVKAEGGLCLKYTNPTVAGYPDRLILMPGAPDVWVEVKSRGRKVGSLQAFRIGRLRDMGRMVRVCDSREQAEEIVAEIKSTYLEGRQRIRSRR